MPQIHIVRTVPTKKETIYYVINKGENHLLKLVYKTIIQ